MEVRVPDALSLGYTIPLFTMNAHSQEGHLPSGAAVELWNKVCKGTRGDC